MHKVINDAAPEYVESDRLKEVRWVGSKSSVTMYVEYGWEGEATYIVEVCIGDVTYVYYTWWWNFERRAWCEYFNNRRKSKFEATMALVE